MAGVRFFAVGLLFTFCGSLVAEVSLPAELECQNIVRIEKALTNSVTWNFKETPFQDVLEEIRKSLDANVLCDAEKLQEALVTEVSAQF